MANLPEIGPLPPIRTLSPFDFASIYPENQPASNVALAEAMNFGPVQEKSQQSLSPNLAYSNTSNSLNENAPIRSKEVAAQKDVKNQTIAPRPKPWIFFTSLAAIYAVAFLYGIDTTVAADVQASIYKSLGNIDKIAWVGVGFPLGSAGSLLPVAMAYRRFNLKALINAGLMLFELGSVLCGAAPTMTALIFGRCIAGTGGCMVYIGALNYVTVYTTIKERAIYMSLIIVSWAVGTILGPVVGGAFASSSVTWRWAFYINVCIYALVGPISVFLMPSYNPRPDLSFKTKMLTMDWIGSILIAAFFVAFIIAFSFAGSTWAWDSGSFIATLVVCIITLVAFIIQQGLRLFTSREHQIFPVWFLKRKSMILLFISTACITAAAFIATYYIPLYFQFAHSDSAIAAAVRLLPLISTNIAYLLISGALLPITRHYAPWYLASGLTVLIGGCTMYTVHPSTPAAHVYGFSALIGLSSGQFGYSVAAAKTYRSPHDLAHTVGFINLDQIGGVAISLCVSGQIFQSVALQNLRDVLRGSGLTDNEIRESVAGTLSPVFERASQEIKTKAVRAVSDAIDMVYVQVIVCGVVVVVCALLMKWERLAFETVPREEDGNGEGGGTGQQRLRCHHQP